MSEEAPLSASDATIRSAMLAIVGLLPSDAPPDPPTGSQRDETLFHDSGAVVAWRGYRPLPPPSVSFSSDVLGLYVRLQTSGDPPCYHLRVPLKPQAVSTLFASREFGAWDADIQKLVAAGLGLERPHHQPTAQILVIEGSHLPPAQADPEWYNQLTVKWHALFGALDSAARPFRVGETLFISPPHVMGGSRVASVITRQRPEAIKAEDLALPIALDYLFRCWVQVLLITQLREELRSSVFYGRTVQQYLTDVGWESARSNKIRRYEQHFLKDRQASVEVVLKAKAENSRVEKRLQGNPFRNLRDLANDLPITRATFNEYRIAAYMAKEIEEPLEAIGGEIVEVETRATAISDFLRDSASAEVERTNLNIQHAMIWLTVATILFGILSIALEIGGEEWKGHIRQSLGLQPSAVTSPDGAR